MEKDFDTWNKTKKIIHANRPNKLYHERDIWWCSLGINIGYEEDGTGKNNERPVLILKGFSAYVCLVVPLTTSEKKNRYYFPIGIVKGRMASVILSQIRLIDTRRFIDKISRLDMRTFEKIRKTVKELL